MPRRFTVDPAVRAVAEQEALDGLRGRRQLLIRAVLPVLLFGVVFATALITRGPEQRDRDVYVVAVEGDVEGAAGTLGLLGDSARVEPTDDAAAAVSGGAAIGIVVPDGLDRARAEGRPTRIEVYRSARFRWSSAALALLVAAVGDEDLAALEQAVDSGGGTADRGVATFGVVDVQVTAAGTRELTGGLAPALLTLQAAMLVSGTATHLLARQRRGLLTAQLLLPLSRWRLALAKTAGVYVVSMVAAAPVLSAILVGVAAIAVTRRGVVAACMDLLACTVAAVALSLLAAAVGLAIGTRARSQEQVSLLTMLTVVVFAVVAALFALGTHPPVGPVALVPLAGLVSSLRDVLTGEGSVAWFAVAVLSTAVGAIALVARTASHFDAERLVLRGSS